MRAGLDGTDSAYRWGAAALLLTVVTIVSALAFEYVGGYKPCPLCLMQRWAYYAAIPGLFVSLALYTGGHRLAGAFLFLAVAAVFLANAGLGVYHAGAEWEFWHGPDTCTGEPELSKTPGSLLDSLQKPQVVRCDKPEFRFLGLSFAGYNVLISLAGAAATLKAAIDAFRR